MSNDLDTAALNESVTPKSDQLNADDLIAGPITVTVTAVKRGDTKEQPAVIQIDGGRQPYKPCKSMRRVLIAAWGDAPAEWVGRSMTLYCDPSVMFGGLRVGGIRISHMSHLDKSSVEFLLTTTRSKRAPFTVRRLDVKPTPAQPESRPATGDVTDQQIDELRPRISKHIQDDAARKRYVLETLGVKGNPTKGSSWTREQYAAATIFCDELEGPV